MAYWSVGKVLNVIDNNYSDVVFIFSVRDFSVGKQLLIVSGKLLVYCKFIFNLKVHVTRDCAFSFTCSLKLYISSCFIHGSYKYHLFPHVHVLLVLCTCTVNPFSKKLQMMVKLLFVSPTKPSPVQ